MKEEDMIKMAENVRHLKLLAHVAIYTGLITMIALHFFGDYLP